MFWSKIWFFLVALVAVVAATIALVMPKPAQRDTALEERSRLVVGCGVVRIQLADRARKRVGLVGTFARDDRIVTTLVDATAADKLDDDRMKKAQQVGKATLGAIKDEVAPTFAMLIDHRGRVVARVGVEEDDYGDVVAGRPLVDDALAGYLRDDIWVQGKNTLYFVSASPVVKRGEVFTYAGAVVLGYKVTGDLASTLVVPGPQPIQVGVFLGGETVATSMTAQLDAQPLAEAAKALTGDREHDCETSKQLEEKSGADAYNVVVARLPGEAGERGAFVAAFTHAPDTVGFGGTLGKITQGDLSFGSFPWILVGGGFVVVLGLGLTLMIVEADRPLRRLTADTVRLAKGEKERLSEEAHGGKFGSIARSINIHIDKLGREAKSAKKDLDQLLGPAPEGSLGTIDLLATALPARPGGSAPLSPPPPSEFRFGGEPAARHSDPMMPSPATAVAPPAPAPVPAQPSRPATPPRGAPPGMPGMPAMANNPSTPGMPPVRPPTPLPIPMPAPLPMPTPLPAPLPVAPAHTPYVEPRTQSGPPMPQTVSASSPPMRLDDDILGTPSPDVSLASGPMDAIAAGGVDPYFKSVYDQFIQVKKTCGEPTTGLTYEKFSSKLVKNRDELRVKTGCREVRFTVYVKDGKAALKATPVKDE